MIRALLATVSTIVDSAARIAEARLASVTALAETGMWLAVGLVVLVLLAVLFVFNPMASIFLVAVLAGTYWMVSR